VRDALSILSTVFGLPSFRGAPRESIEQVAGRDDCSRPLQPGPSFGAKFFPPGSEMSGQSERSSPVVERPRPEQLTPNSRAAIMGNDDRRAQPSRRLRMTGSSATGAAFGENGKLHAIVQADNQTIV